MVTVHKKNTHILTEILLFVIYIICDQQGPSLQEKVQSVNIS